MSTLVIRDSFGDVYLLAPANRHPEHAEPLEPLLGHLAAWVLKSCSLDDNTLARFLSEAETSGIRPRVRADASWQDDLPRLLGSGEEGRFTLWRVVRARPACDQFEAYEDAPMLSDLAEAPMDEPQVWFEVEVVDEAGEPLSGVELRFSVTGATETKTTDGDGKARLDTNGGSYGNVTFVSAHAVRDEVEPRWTAPRNLMDVADRALTRLAVASLSSGVSIESKVTHLIVVEPPLGKIFMELRDRSGRVPLPDCAYTIEGPQKLEGRTDEAGRLLHEGIFAGDYTLNVTVETKTSEDAEPLVDEYSTPAVVLEASDAKPQVRCLAAVPRITMARLRGLLFDTNKAFLLPTALPAMRRVRKLWGRLDPVELVIVGHTDTTGDPSVNDPLSQERAKSMEAFLRDDVDAWLANYDASGQKRWGGREDRLMLSHMPGFATREPGQDLVRWFQQTRGLYVDGVAGPQTRKALITEYMALDGPKLTDDAEFHLSISTLGCGDNHPLAANPTDDQNDANDRRVELLFFDTEFGVAPAVEASDGPEYANWLKRAEVVEDALIEGMGNQVQVLELPDTLFRLDSAVVLPEGEAPDPDEHQALTSVGVFATLLRYNQEHDGRKLLIAGHTDTSGGKAHNLTLSRERAQCALALLTGDREGFVSVANGRYKVGDYKQILSWCTAAFGQEPIGEGGFDCAPEKVDEVAWTATEPLRRFQDQYNQNRGAIGAGDQPELSVDGAIGPMTWGALFDVYQHGIAQELGEDAAGVASLRGKLVFLRDGDETLGFGEYHPIDQPHRDSFRSQANRRIEILLFDSTADLDIDLAKEHPDISELYLPGVYQRKPIDPMLSAKPWRARWDRPSDPAQHEQARAILIDAPGAPAGTPFSVEVFAKVGINEPIEVGTLEGVSEAGAVRLEFADWDAAVTEPTPEKELDTELPRVEFSFVVIGGGRELPSPTLRYADTLSVNFVHAEDEEPCAQTEYFVLTSWGYLPGVTDDEGHIEVTGLPPGGARAILAHVDAVRQTDG